MSHHDRVFILFIDSLSDYVFGGRSQPRLLGLLFFKFISLFCFHFILLRDAPDLILRARIHQHVRLGALLVLRTLEQECLYFVCHIIYKNLDVFLLHLELLQLILQFAHLLLFLKYRIFFLLEECIEVPHIILISLLLSLHSPELISQVLYFMLTSLLEILYLYLKPLDFLIIFGKLLLICKLPITQPVKSRLLRLVQVVIEYNNRFILSYCEAHIAYTVLFRVIYRELLLVF